MKKNHFFFRNKEAFEISREPKENKRKDNLDVAGSNDDAQNKRNQQSIFISKMNSKKYQEENKKNSQISQTEFS